MDSAPTTSPSELPVATLEFEQVMRSVNEAEKLHFALKTIGIIPGMLPHALVENIRVQAISLVVDEGGGRYRIETDQVNSLRLLVQERLAPLVAVVKNPPR